MSNTKPKSWRDQLPIHPAAELFPLMSKSELRELADDIKKNCEHLHERVSLWDDPDRGTCLIDGRNRLDALELLGEVEKPSPYSRVYEWVSERNFDPYAYVISKNIHRRHLTVEQKRELIAKVLKAKPEQSNRQIAKQVKADDKTVAKVRRDMESTAEIPQLEKTVGADGKARRQPAHKPASNVPPKQPRKRRPDYPISESGSVDEFMKRAMIPLGVLELALGKIALSDPALARQCVERITAELNAAIPKAIREAAEDAIYAAGGDPSDSSPGHEQMLLDGGLPEAFIRSRGQ
jgi:hypothetical protein